MYSERTVSGSPYAVPLVNFNVFLYGTFGEVYFSILLIHTNNLKTPEINVASFKRVLFGVTDMTQAENNIRLFHI